MSQTRKAKRTRTAVACLKADLRAVRARLSGLRVEKTEADERARKERAGARAARAELEYMRRAYETMLRGYMLRSGHLCVTREAAPFLPHIEFDTRDDKFECRPLQNCPAKPAPLEYVPHLRRVLDLLVELRHKKLLHAPEAESADVVLEHFAPYINQPHAILDVFSQPELLEQLLAGDRVHVVNVNYELPKERDILRELNRALRPALESEDT